MGGDHVSGFQAIQEYFQRKSCKQCSSFFSQDGIELLRQEPGVLVVRVTCASCGHPLGVAIVGTAPKAEKKAPSKALSEWTRRDRKRLADKPPISYDDVLHAHQFFQSLESDWAKYLPSQK